MTNIVQREALALLLRSKTALGRLVDSEVHSVLDYLESIGFVYQAPQPVAAIEPPPAVLTPDAQVAAQVAQVLPVAPVVAPVSALASLESIIEKDVKAFFEPAPIAPPPQ